MGRFITEDPIKDGNNWYAYCANNPLTFIDPTGLEYHGISMPAGAMRDGGYDKNGNFVGRGNGSYGAGQRPEYTGRENVPVYTPAYNNPIGQFRDIPQEALDYMNSRDTKDSSNSSPIPAATATPAEPDTTPEASGSEDTNTKNPFDIYAVKEGKIIAIKTDDDNAYGNRVYIKHKDGSVTLYAHLKSVDSGLSVGDRVEGGQVIGVMGKTGTKNRHLHFSYFAPGVKSYTPGNASDGSKFISDGGHQPANTKVSNEYGSKFRHPSLKHHEGIDYSGKKENLRDGWNK